MRFAVTLDRMESKTLLKIADAAEALSVGKTTVWELIRAGKLATVRLGKRAVRIPMAELNRLIEEATEER